MLNFLLFFMPLTAIVVLGVYISVLLYNRRKKNIRQRNMMRLARKLTIISFVANSQSESTSTTISRNILAYNRVLAGLGLEAKLQIIIISYWIQYLPSILILLFNPFCQCVSDNVTQGIYWMTFTVSMTNPIFVLLFNKRM